MKDILNYKNYSYNNFSYLHGMTAYLAMFPPNIPNYLINNFSQIGDLILDPFSGRGTAPFEACRNGRIGIGNDLNPLAFCLTKSKINLPKISNILKRISLLKNLYYEQEEYYINSVNLIAEDIKMLYEETTTLPQLFFLKNTLNRHRKVDNFILAVLTGIMHGKHRKDGTSIYCSIDMPNTFSMSPNYIKKFIETHRLQKIKQNVFDLLADRVNKLFRIKNYDESRMNEYSKGYCFNKDAIECSNAILKKYGKNSIQLIVTSPPYLKNINYGKYNWIRLWLLNEDVKKVDTDVSIYHQAQKIRGIKDNLPFKQYAIYMQNLFNSWYDILKLGSYAFVVIGDVEKQNLANDTWNFIENNGGCKLKYIDIIADNIEEKCLKKVTRIWGKKSGKATKIDRILILKKEI